MKPEIKLMQYFNTIKGKMFDKSRSNINFMFYVKNEQLLLFKYIAFSSERIFWSFFWKIKIDYLVHLNPTLSKNINKIKKEKSRHIQIMKHSLAFSEYCNETSLFDKER